MNVTLPSPPDPASHTAGALYQSGFGNGFETEALPGALPVGRNSPQRCAYGLYAEQLSGSAFTAPRAANERSWLYPIRPTVSHWGRFRADDAGDWLTAPAPAAAIPPAPLRWDPLPLPTAPVTFLRGVHTISTAGDAAARAGMAAHIYLITAAMVDEYCYNADGELLFVPQQGALRLCTEFGVIDVGPGEIAVIPRGVKFRVELHGEPARGYLCENYGGAFTLPDRSQLPRQSARFPHARRLLRGPRDAIAPGGKMGRRALADRDRPVAAGRRRLARQLRAV
jgi:homogentisate 1,2-dioxygenase